MKKTLLFLLSLFFIINLNAQDIIIKIDKSEIRAKVVEITNDGLIKYYNIDQLSGPLRNISKYEVNKIIYQNGKIEIFTDDNNNKPGTVNQQNQSSNDQQLGSFKYDNSKTSEKSRFFIRAGAGVQGGISIFYPQDLNDFVSDFCDDITNQFSELGISNDDMGTQIPIFMGVLYNYKADARLFNILQLDIWGERFFGMASGITYKFTYNYSYYDYVNSQYIYNNASVKSTYKFSPGYSAYGFNILMTPGARKKHVAFTYGLGIAEYNGKLQYTAEGNEIQNIGSIITNPNQPIVVNNIDESAKFTGSVIGYNGIIGLTFIPRRMFEIELFLNGRYARIPELKSENGSVLYNYNRNKKVSLDFSGLDLRLGFKLMFP